MTLRAHQVLDRAALRGATGVLLVTRDAPAAAPASPGQPAVVPPNAAEGPEILLAVWDDGSVTAFSGHVDLGTGLRTALAQIVAEELDVALDQIAMVLGDTSRAPNQGATIASASIQLHAAPLRSAAAQARAWLIAAAAQRAGLSVGSLVARAGVVRLVDDRAEQNIAYASLVAGQHIELSLASDVALKSQADYTIVGHSAPRVDIGAKATGELVFVHDMRMPGMLHGRVVRPPYAGVDQGDWIGNTLESVDESSIAHIAGIRAVVVIRDFVGIVAEREEDAEQALQELQVRWKQWPGVPMQDSLEGALRAQPSSTRRLVEEGDVDAAMARAAHGMARTYVWPYQLHASLGPSCALAHWHGDATQPTTLTVWAGSQNPHVLRAELATLMVLPETAIEVVRMEASGCYGRNCADDVAADAALLSRAVGAPVRVQLTREQENLWEPKGAAQLMQVNGGLNIDGSVAAYDFQASYPSNGAPTLALLLTRTIEPIAQVFEMGDRTARPPYAFENLRVSVNDMPPILRASWLRGVSALPNSFAHESYIDELAIAAGEDPVAYRLRYLSDPRAIELLKATAAKAGWQPRDRAQRGNADATDPNASAELLRGQGVAYARYSHGKWPGVGSAWSAWVADVEVNQVTGEVHVKKVVVGHDAGLMINPAGVRHQIHGNVVQATSRTLTEQVLREPGSALATNREWGSYPILNFRQVPMIEVLTIQRPGEMPLGAGESASVPGTAAIANAIFDATGVRFRQPPFTPEVVREGLRGRGGAAQVSRAAEQETVAPRAAPSPPQASRLPRHTGILTRGALLVTGIVGLAAALLGWRHSLAPVTHLAGTPYTQATLERGRVLAAAGDCAVCHTAPGGMPNAGGRAIDTPFGTIFSTNITPDVDTGIGSWSLAAFERAMREGLSRDGHHLYPAFPYTAFAKLSDDDVTALYAYLMAEPAVAARAPATRLAFPLNIRPLMAGWNALFHDPAPYLAPPAATTQWARGEYLVTGIGHCGGCHTSRNLVGAEQSGSRFLAGAIADGWEAPALTSLSRAPLPWSADELFRYLRSGSSEFHGLAGGPMLPVVQGLKALPDEDIRAMAHYLASLNAPTADEPALARSIVTSAARTNSIEPSAAQRLFDGACGACHHDGDGPSLIGLNVPLALNSNLHSVRPDNVIRTVLEGVRETPDPKGGFMPAFGDALSDRQIGELVQYMRARFAPTEIPWNDPQSAVAALRATR